MIRQGLYLITDERLMPHDQLIPLLQRLLQHGSLSVLQYRAKHLPFPQQRAQASALAQLCQDADVPFLVNDNIPLAKAIHASGVHLGQHDTPIAQARHALGDDAVIGVSCYNSLQRARQAQTASADYVAFGRFFPSHSKPDAPPATLETLCLARQTLSIPIVAIGGITTDNGPALLQAGADLLAVIHGVLGAPDPLRAACALQQLFNHDHKEADYGKSSQLV